MKSKLLYIIAILSIMNLSCDDKNFKNEYDPLFDTDLWIAFPGDKDSYNEDIPVNTTMKFLAYIKAKAGIKTVEYQYLFGSESSEAFKVEPDPLNPDYLELKVSQMFDESFSDIRGWKVTATDNNGQVVSNTYSLNGNIIKNADYYQYKGVELACDIDLSTYAIKGKAYFGAQLTPPVATYSQARTNAGDVDLVYIWDFEGNANRLITPSIRTMQPTYIPNVISKYVPDDFLPQKVLYMTTVPIDDATFDQIFLGTQATYDGAVQLLMLGMFPNARLRSVPQAGQTFFIRINGPETMSNLGHITPDVRFGFIKVRQVNGIGADSKIVIDYILQR